MHVRSNALFAIALLTAYPSMTGCKPPPSASLVKDEGAFSSILDGVIPDGVLIAKTGDDMSYQRLILDQLQFGIGPLNQRNAVINKPSTVVTIIDKQPFAQIDGYTAVKFSATTRIAWPTEVTVPAQIQLVLPGKLGGKSFVSSPTTVAPTESSSMPPADIASDGASPSSEGAASKVNAEPAQASAPSIGKSDTEAFYEAFKEKCAEDASGLPLEMFWYIYRPTKTDCPLASLANSNAGTSELVTISSTLVARLTMTLGKSKVASEGRKPEYDQLWSKDGNLIATIVVGRDHFKYYDDSDLGLGVYVATYKKLLETYGQPTSSSGGFPSLENRDISATFAVGQNQRLTVNMLLFDEVNLDAIQAEPKSKFDSSSSKQLQRDLHDVLASKLGQISQGSNFVMYTGHAGGGGNIRAMSQMVKISPQRYYLYMMDACDTYAYGNPGLEQMVADASRGFPTSKYLDVISNAMPAPFSSGVPNIMILMDAMVGRTKTYKEILSQVTSEQRAIVSGEQDNGQPFPPSNSEATGIK